MGAEYYNQYILDGSKIIIFIIIFILIIPIIAYWLSIRKKNPKLKKIIDICIFILFLIIVIGLIISATIIVEIAELIEDGNAMDSIEVYNYDLSIIGDSIWLVGLLFIIMVVKIYSMKEIKYKKIIKFSKTLISILIILIIFFTFITIFGYPNEDNYYNHEPYDSYYHSIIGVANPNNSIELVYNNYNEVHVLTIKDDEIINDQRFETNAEDNIGFANDNTTIYGIYGNFYPTYERKQVDPNPIENLQIIEIPEIHLRSPPVVEIDSQKNFHLGVANGDLSFENKMEDLFYYGDEGYFIYYPQSKKLKQIIKENIMAIEIDSNDNIYLVYSKISEAIKENITINYTISGNVKHETRDVYYIEFWLQKRALDGEIIYDLKIDSLFEDPYDWIEYAAGIVLDTNNSINVVYGSKEFYSQYDEYYLKYIKLDINGEVLINSTNIDNISMLSKIPVFKDDNENLIFIQNIQPFIFYDWYQENYYGLIENNNNISLFYYENEYIISEKYDNNGTFIEQKSLIRIPTISEKYLLGDYLIIHRIFITLFFLAIASVFIIKTDLILYSFGCWKLKNKGISIFVENNVS
jgi:hypothetical protein